MKFFKSISVAAAALIFASMPGCTENLGRFDAKSANTIYLVDCVKNQTVTLKNGEGEDDFDRLVDICTAAVKKSDREDVPGVFGNSRITFETDDGETNLYPSADSGYLARDSYDGDSIEYIKLSDSDMKSLISILGSYGVKVTQ